MGYNYEKKGKNAEEKKDYKKPKYKNMLKYYEHELAEEHSKFKKEATVETLCNITKILEAIRYLMIAVDKSKKHKYDDDDHVKPVFTEAMAKEWVANMEGADGKKGGHWTIEQTSLVAKQKGIVFEHISDYCWWATMNMKYSDGCKTAAKYNVDTVDFYVDEAKDFLFDVDSVSPKEKLYWYYTKIVKK